MSSDPSIKVVSLSQLKMAVFLLSKSKQVLKEKVSHIRYIKLRVKFVFQIFGGSKEEKKWGKKGVEQGRKITYEKWGKQ